MTVLAIVLASIVGYFVIGAYYARSTITWNYQRIFTAKQQHDRRIGLQSSWRDLNSEHAMRDAREGVVGRVLFWPVMMIVDLFRGRVRSWFEQPIQDRRNEAKRLRAEADLYDALIRACTDPTDRNLMRKGQEALRAQARDLDL